jgi:hypothetical protein
MRFLTVLLLACLTACGERSGVPDVVVRDSAGIEIVQNTRPQWDGEGWRLSDDPIFTVRGAEENDDALLLEPVSVFRSLDGSYYVADGGLAGANAVWVYHADGRLKQRCGREGSGPGEFSWVMWAKPYRGDSVLVWDAGANKIHVFDLDCRFGRDIRIPMWWPEIPSKGAGVTKAGSAGAFSDGSLLTYPMGGLDVSAGVGPTWFQHEWLRLDPEGETWDTLGVFAVSQEWWNGKERESMYLGLSATTAVHGDRVYFGTGDRFEVALYDTSGALVRLIRRPYDRPRVTDEDKAAYANWYVAFLANAMPVGKGADERMYTRILEGRFGERWPAYSSLVVDSDGNLWVEGYRRTALSAGPDPKPTDWSVFDPNGRWLGNVTVPARFLLQAVHEGHAMGFFEEELGTKRLEVYELTGAGR